MACITLRLTAANLDDLRVGDVIVGAEDLGPVRSARATRDSFGNARIYGEVMSDFFGLPITLEVERDA